jgi:nucleotide-binding universal stress UspA family protein
VNAALRILVPTDGSDPSRRATVHVLDLAARGLAVEVHLLNVQPAVRGVAASLVSQSDLEGYHRDEGLKALAESLHLVEAAGLKPHPHVCVGDPGEMVLAFARRLNCDQIVMGTRGHGSVTELLLGSVARQVVAEAAVPVTLLR